MIYLAAEVLPYQAITASCANNCAPQSSNSFYPWKYPGPPQLVIARPSYRLTRHRMHDDSTLSAPGMSATGHTAALPPPTTTAHVQAQHHFFDIAPEIRNQVYHHLFEGKEIVIRQNDYKVVWQNDETVHINNFERNRSLGLNILFVSKQTHVEAKSILMGTAIFDLDHWTLRRCGDLTSVFRAPDLRLVRSLNMKDGTPAALRSASVIMKGLHKVTMHADLRNIHAYGPKPLAEMLAKYAPKSTQAFPGMNGLQYSWEKSLQFVFRQFLQNAAGRDAKDSMQFIIKVPVVHRCSKLRCRNYVSFSGRYKLVLDADRHRTSVSI